MKFKADVVIAVVIALAGAVAIGQAVSDGAATNATKGQVTNPAVLERCSSPPLVPKADARANVTFAAVGDTVTDWKSRKSLAATSWVTYADTGNVELVGGWAKEGVGTERISLAAKPTDADVAVILTGTNDLMFPFVYDNVELSLQKTVDKLGTDKVLLSSVPPVDAEPAKTAKFNAWLARVAYRHDWAFVDAGSAVRSGRCKYRKGMTTDGVRPTPEGARLIGEAIHSALTRIK